MPVPTPAPRADAPQPAQRADQLEHIARGLLAPDGAGPIDTPRLALALSHGDAVEVALRPCGGDPSLALRGLQAPDDCIAIGVLTPGLVHRLGRASIGADDVARAGGRATSGLLDLGVHHPDRSTTHRSIDRTDEATLVLLVDTDGDVIYAERHGDGPIGSWRVGPGAETQGRLLDACLRVHGLPTDPPATGICGLVTTMWLHHIDELGLQQWADMVDIHPATTLLGRPIDAPDDPASGLIEAAEVIEAGCRWEDIRRWLDRSSEPLLGIRPEEAAWFDAGSFSRAALEALVPADELLAGIEARLDPDVAHRLRLVVTAATTEPS